jgi:hypothetical protein
MQQNLKLPLIGHLWTYIINRQTKSILNVPEAMKN